jgi:hypothetical protein
MAEVSVEKLRGVVSKALQDDAFAERVFSEPRTVASEEGLTADEALVLEQMDRSGFDTARQDAANESSELSDDDLANVAGGAGTTSFSTLGVATDMLVGRCIIKATGGSYANLTNAACDCCAWKGGISAGGMVTLPSS